MAHHLSAQLGSGAQTPSLTGTHTPSLTAMKRHPDLQHHKTAEGGTGDGIDTPGHAHHFSNKGIDPSVLNSSLKKHIAKGAHEGERRLNDFSADPDERLNPHFLETVKKVIDEPASEEGKEPDAAPAEETKA